MSYRQTFVIEYASVDHAPCVTANMGLLGGKLVAVQFNDALAELESADKLDELYLTETGVSDLFNAANDYFMNYLQDEADSLMVCNGEEDQHEKAKALKAAIARYKIRINKGDEK